MKSLNSFTVERLEEFIRQPLESGLTRSEQMELARIALAAKRAEPIGYVAPEALRYKNFDNVIMIEKASGRRSMPLYTTPQLNSPEMPEGWNGTLETAAKLIDLCRTHTILNDSGSYKERIINDCELTMQEIESYLAAAPEKENG
ncbi:hypothetical protein RSG19_003914 [Yersinia enterocolitica]|nr:hypothetical protein [Yersinia enterocolitica]ELI8444507.1 hypothetical protein [Yersinia enterocolitica]